MLVSAAFLLHDSSDFQCQGAGNLQIALTSLGQKFMMLTLVRCMQVWLHQVGLRGAPAAAESAARGPCQDFPLQHDSGPHQVGHPTPVHSCHHLST